jgi:hypothetical protein
VARVNESRERLCVWFHCLLMIGTLINVIVYLLIAGLIWWAVTTILGIIPLPEPIKTVINVLMIVVICLIVIYALLGLLGGAPNLRLGHFSSLTLSSGLY